MFHKQHPLSIHSLTIFNLVPDVTFHSAFEPISTQFIMHSFPIPFLPVVYARPSTAKQIGTSSSSRLVFSHARRFLYFISGEKCLPQLCQCILNWIKSSISRQKVTFDLTILAPNGKKTLLNKHLNKQVKQSPSFYLQLFSETLHFIYIHFTKLFILFTFFQLKYRMVLKECALKEFCWNWSILWNI